MKRQFRVISPVDGRIVATIAEATPTETARTLDSASKARREWRAVPLADRVQMIGRFVDHMESRIDEMSELLTLQMGRPIAHVPGEIRGMAGRARHMAAIAADSLADVVPEAIPGFQRFVRREPHGVVLVLSPWNYPYLTAVNAVVPALLAGNCVILKHSDQTPLVAEHFREGFEAAGLPPGVFQVLHLFHDSVAQVIEDTCIDHIAFTGSVEGGKAICRAAQRRAEAGRFINVGLELGGKDPAYVRADADIDHAVENLVDGAFFNAGQSCCAVERIYVHKDRFDAFVDGFVSLTKQYRLGDPLDPETNLGPVVRQRNADRIRAQVTAALEAGARPMIDSARFDRDRADTPYMAPSVLTNVNHKMALMSEETFGPAIGIMAIDDDEAAIQAMNDSEYGLTASIWTEDQDAAMVIAQQVEAGTVFMNRCDALDPALAWTGVKASGRGTSLSAIGFEALTRPKSYHFKTLK